MKVDHGGVDAFVSQQIFNGQNIQSFFQQMGGVGMPQGMDVHRLLNPCFLFGFIHCPLHTPLGIAGVKVSADPTFDLLIFAVEYPFIGLLCFQIGFQSTDENIRKWDVAVFLSFAFLYVKHLSVKIQIGNLQIPNFEAAKPTAIQQTDQHPVFEQFGSLEQSADFFLTQDNRKLFASLDGWKFDPLILHSFDPISEPKGVNGKLEVGVRGRVMTSLDQMKIIVDPVRVHFGRQFIEVNRQFGQMAGIVG